MPKPRALRATSGSSPRTWGTRLASIWRMSESRFIPTHVGNTLGRNCPRPRYHGSSPRTWGTLRGESRARRCLRFIPTHVGNTGKARTRTTARPVHPHARGEHLGYPSINILGRGSSPRTWGTPQDQCSGKAPRRFIPTHVGNTWWMRASASKMPVHPHARGEHKHAVITEINRDGSSPRTWGTPVQASGGRRDLRFIPTHVGNTRYKIGVVSPVAVHPHARGEHTDWIKALKSAIGSSPRTWGTRPTGALHAIPQSGSSPRTWGTPVTSGVYVAFRRFIPTHVGNTSCPPPAATQRTVHPHARGEHRGAMTTEDTRAGSSPRTWGTLSKRLPRWSD